MSRLAVSIDGVTQAPPSAVVIQGIWMCGVAYASPLYPIAHGVFSTRSTTSLDPCMSRDPSLKSVSSPRTASWK